MQMARSENRTRDLKEYPVPMVDTMCGLVRNFKRNLEMLARLRSALTELIYRS